MSKHPKNTTSNLNLNKRAGRTRRRSLAITCLIFFSTACASWFLYAHLNAVSASKPREQPATKVAATIEAPQPIYVVENTVFGRKVRLVSPGAASPKENTGQTARN